MKIVMLNSLLHIGDSGIAKFTLPFISFNLGKATWNVSLSFFLAIENGPKTSLEGTRRRSHMPEYSKPSTYLVSHMIIARTSYEFSSNIGARL